MNNSLHKIFNMENLQVFTTQAKVNLRSSAKVNNGSWNNIVQVVLAPNTLIGLTTGKTQKDAGKPSLTWYEVNYKGRAVWVRNDVVRFANLNNSSNTALEIPQEENNNFWIYGLIGILALYFLLKRK